MKVEFPSYTNDKLDTTYDINTNTDVPDVITIEISDDNYFKSIEEVKNYLEKWNYIKNIETIKEQIENSIINKKIPKFISENDNIDIHIKTTYSSIPYYKKEQYKQKYNDLITLRKTNFSKSFYFIKENKDEVYSIFDNILEEKYNKRKEAWRDASKKYYDKIKEQKPKVKRNVYTKEEKKERRKKANAKYYEKLKEENI